MPFAFVKHFFRIIPNFFLCAAQFAAYGTMQRSEKNASGDEKPSHARRDGLLFAGYLLLLARITAMIENRIIRISSVRRTKNHPYRTVLRYPVSTVRNADAVSLSLPT